MAATAPKLVQTLFALMSCLALAGAGGKSQIATPKGPVNYEAKQVDVDFRTQQAILRGDVVITQGDISVSADRAEASSLDFKDSRWTFTGNVSIHAEQHGTLHSDKAVIEFRNDRMEKATITGNPAEFEQTQSDTGLKASGHAHSIEYQVAPGTIQLTEDAWLTDGRGTAMSGPSVTYNIHEQRVQSEGSDNQRVHITILPKQDNQGSKP
jgi:lipopolysaccharide transport protein LptA